MTKFVKPNNDRIFYLFSSKAQKTNDSTKTYEYRWDINDITLNDAGKLSLIGRSYKTMDVITTPIITRIMNISSQDDYNTGGGSGGILDISCWNYLIPFVIDNHPPINISPQTINHFVISVNDDISTVNNGTTTTNEFCLILKLTEGDREIVSFGSTNDINVNQRQFNHF